MVAANYIVVMDGKENVKAGFTKECPAPSNMATEWAPVLTFMVDAVGSLDGFKFKVRVTPQGTNVFTDVYSATYSGNHYHSVQEVMPKNLLKPSETALINFSWHGGDGDIQISDIVVWVRVNLPVLL
jgi:hypothetical protein